MGSRSWLLAWGGGHNVWVPQLGIGQGVSLRDVERIAILATVLVIEITMRERRALRRGASTLLSLGKRELRATRQLRIRALGATGRVAEAASY